MKISRILYLIAIIFSSFPLLAQEEEDIPFALIEKHPYYLQTDTITGEIKEIPFKKFLDQWVMKNFQYPKRAVEEMIQGKVIVIFKIDEKGIFSIEEIREGDPLLQEEACRVFDGFPQLFPALQGDKPVSITIAYPIAFRLAN